MSVNTAIASAPFTPHTALTIPPEMVSEAPGAVLDSKIALAEAIMGAGSVDAMKQGIEANQQAVIDAKVAEAGERYAAEMDGFVSDRPVVGDMTKALEQAKGSSASYRG